MASCGLTPSSWRPVVHLQKVRQRLQGSAPLPPPPAGGRPGPSAGGGRLALFVAGPCPGRRGARGARAGVFAMRGAAAGTIWMQHPKPALVADECVEVHLLPLTVACISSVRQLPHGPTPARGRRGAPGRPPWRKGGWARRRPAWPTRSHRGSARGHAAHTRQGRLDRLRVGEAAGQVWRQVQDAPEDDGQSDFARWCRKIAVFSDGDFWYGYKCRGKKKRAGKCWRGRIERNLGRNRHVARRLKKG